MDLKEYIKPIKNIEQFLENEKPRDFDFLRQGKEADNTNLTRMIYSELFPWYDKQKHSGDTLITYRIAIGKKYYSNYYMLLSREIQNEILEINRKYNSTSLLEFEIQGKIQTYYQICNNYKIGNFGIFPKGSLYSGINTARARAPYYDCFDLTLEKIKDLYDGKLIGATPLEKSLLQEKEYFNYFKSFDEYVKSNYLSSYFDERGNIIELSKIDNYDEYIKVSNDIINKRGKEMVNSLRNKVYQDKI